MNNPILHKSPSPPIPKASSLRAARQAERPTPSRLSFLRQRRHKQSAAVTFSPLAWLKLLMFLHAGDTEVGGFGISGENRPLYIEDFITVKQSVTATTVAFDDTAVADYFDACIDQGLTPARFARIWAHTHPGESPEPSSVDEETFYRVFGQCDWAVMLIVSRTHATYARMSFSAGPGGAILLPVTVDWAAWPQFLLEQGSSMSVQFERWMDEYGQNVCPALSAAVLSRLPRDPGVAGTSGAAWANDPWLEEDIYAHHEQMGLNEEFEHYYQSSAAEGR